MRGRAALSGGLVIAAVATAPALARADGTISGQVKNTRGAVVPNVCTRVIGARRTFTAITDIYGRWSKAVPAGSWRVQFDGCGQNYIPQWWPGRSAYGGSGRLIRVSNGKSVGGIDGELSPGGQITGQLVDGVTGDPFAAANAFVSVDRAGGSDAGYRFFDGGFGGRPFAPVEPVGLFLLSGLPSGTYTVSAGGSVGGKQLARTWYPSDARAPGRAQRIRVTAGQTTTIGVLHAQHGATITGAVHGAGGGPLPGAAVHATITEPDGSHYTPSTARSSRAGGRYVLHHLPAGRLSVRVAARGYSTVVMPRTVTAGATSRLDVTLHR